MSATQDEPRPLDPRVRRTRAAVVEAARALFLRQGYVGTTIDEIAAAAGVAKRTVYNHYADKDALFREIVGEVIAYAEAFARELPGELAAGIPPGGLPAALDRLAERLASAVVRAETVALRRLLIGEATAFPDLPRDYFERAPGCVLDALTAVFERLSRSRALRVPNPRRAAEQFAYLVVGAPLDRAMLTAEIPSEDDVRAGAHEGVATFLARYGPARGWG